MQAQPKMNHLSRLIVEQKLQMKLIEIFLAFDSQRLGAISSQQIDLDRVSAEILEIFTPLLVEMESLDETLDQEEFVESALALYDTLNISQKAAIMSFKFGSIPL